ncbi:hypothetical protein GCM10009665_62590 [Kitasatospora nipponensis]|uniref:Uncharacterized protein n=1 Tax=Kitasatospora nipponensis TaxID=258049 RepID=A0ABN1WWP4_9ACTN
MTVGFVRINGGPGIVFAGAGRVIGVLTVGLDAVGRIATVHDIANPDKLRDITEGHLRDLGAP